VGVNAEKEAFMYLKRSPYLGECPQHITHAVLLVGWNERYWIIKNQWGPDWGIDGYLYLPRGENKCGVNSILVGAIIFGKVQNGITSKPLTHRFT